MPTSVTTTTDNGKTTTWTVASPFCPKCGGLRTYAIYHPMWVTNAKPCSCVPLRVPGLNLGNAKTTHDFDAPLDLDTPERQAWQCPGCKQWKAPHIDSCGCEA